MKMMSRQLSRTFQAPFQSFLLCFSFLLLYHSCSLCPFLFPWHPRMLVEIPVDVLLSSSQPMMVKGVQILPVPKFSNTRVKFACTRFSCWVRKDRLTAPAATAFQFTDITSNALSRFVNDENTYLFLVVVTRIALGNIPTVFFFSILTTSRKSINASTTFPKILP